MTTSPDLGIPYIANQQSQPEVTHNDALNMLIALQKGAIDKDLNTPPGSPTNGDVYIVGPSPTGAWAGKANKIAIYTTNAWTFVPGNDSSGTNIAIGARHEGMKIWVQDENTLYVWSGSAWAVVVPALPVSIANGGTGQTTAVAAIDALSVKGADIASAATTNLATATGDFVDVTGTTTITALGTAAAGVERVVRFTGALTLTHNATSLILPGATNINTMAGDIAVLRSLGSGNWVCTSYSRAQVPPLIGNYTPTLTNILNVSASTSYSSLYMRVGNWVIVSCRIDIDPTAAGTVGIGVSLPIASNFSASGQCVGLLSTSTVSGEVGILFADVTNDRAQVEMVAVNTANHDTYAIFVYQVI